MLCLQCALDTGLLGFILKEAIESNAYGKCLSLNFKRQTSFPGGAFYSDHNQCGGALLDLHVHDTDFVNYCLGLPEAVFSQGYKGPSGGIDHIVTHYIFNQSDLSPLVSSEGHGLCKKVMVLICHILLILRMELLVIF